MTCMVYVLRECGEWAEALKLGRELIDSDTAIWVAEGTRRGDPRRSGEAELGPADARVLARHGLPRWATTTCTVDTITGLARVAAIEGDAQETGERCRALLALWEEQRGPPLRHQGSALGRRLLQPAGRPRPGARLRRGARADLLGDRPQRCPRRPRAVRHRRDRARRPATPIPPPSSSLTRWSCTAASTCPTSAPRSSCGRAWRSRRCGQRELALERLGDADPTAKPPRRPTAGGGGGRRGGRARRVDRGAPGTPAAADANGAGLSRRELEVVRHLAVGRTNREIAQELFLSSRTVDMHVRNILRKLDCRSRVEASQRAGELGLLEPS